MFQFPGFPTITYGFSHGSMSLRHRGFPIRKSADIMLICSSPRLIAACHVLLRLLMPRHSPCALCAFVPGKFLCSVLALCLELLEFHNKFFLGCHSTREKVFPFLLYVLFSPPWRNCSCAISRALPKFLERLIISYFVL